ncbi:D-glycero-alpha-D-manno-heptose-1,7-bisphosphate 7-phosphatase [Bacteroidota bacterium]|nr:D-glycero-alpha-D-manno-heptose-1,7-bisphosphate 7-phosphatase [Bacteroidota bacterium]
MNLSDLHIDKSWTLFLDRDGVINKKIDNDYIRNLKMFEWIEGSKDAILFLSNIFGKIIVVTNQQGIGKKIMTENDLKAIHVYMKTEIEKSGGRIDAIYFSPHLKEKNNPMRKPGTGMLLKAKQDYPEIDFKKSIMVGDSVSDMEMADRLRLSKVWVGENKSSYINANLFCKSLFDFSKSINKI